MPAIPYVFRPVKSNDVQVRPFKTYKSYHIRNVDDYSGSGYRIHNGLHNIYAVHVGDTTYNYPTNNIDDTNQHVVWRNIDHRYYRYPYDPSRCHELTNIRTVEKYLHYSASILTIPYFDTGERIKENSVTLISNPIGNDTHTLVDDGNGNLRDSLINTGSFASSSNLMFYMSFNNEFRKFEKQFGSLLTSSIKYTLDKQELYANGYNVSIVPGVTDSNNLPTGIAASFTSDTSYIRVPHTKQFDRLNIADYWSVSFWYYLDADHTTLTSNTSHTLISKYAVTNEPYISRITKVLTNRDKIYNIPAANAPVTLWKSIRTPLHIDLYIDSVPDAYIRCTIGNGTNAIQLTGAAGTDQQWHHCVVQNDGCNVTLYIDNVQVDIDALSRNGLSINSADLLIGNYKPNGSVNSIPIELDEIRIYNHTLNSDERTSLYGNNHLSASMYQTNVAGNVFYRNGQIVVTSPLPKYNSGSGFFGNQWTASWQGTHTVYENEVMVRIPSDYMNYTMNPTATYQPTYQTQNSVCGDTTIETTNGPGVLYKSMFTSSFINPYITTVGLYNDSAQLLAIGKLAQPVQKRDDVDMNIIVRWDY